MYVSDRRFMKSIKMLQVAAWADGRAAVSEYDCLLLEFVLGQRPDDAHVSGAVQRSAARRGAARRGVQRRGGHGAPGWSVTL